MTGIRPKRVAAGRRAVRIAHWPVAAAAGAATAALALAACAGTAGTSAAGRPAAGAGTDRVELIGKIDADMGAMGTFTGKDGWPAVAPADIHVRAGATVVITIREYDDMVTPLADNSPFLQVIGGTETVNGKRVRAVRNDMIAHTFTVPSLGINAPLPVASMDGGYTTVRFTFRAPATAGTYQWLCVTPCGTGDYGISGAMHTDGWMRGHLIVS